MNIERIKYLFGQYEARLATEAETEELFQLLEDSSYKEPINDFFIEGIEVQSEVELNRAEWDPVINTILAALPKEDFGPDHHSRRTVRMIRWAAAAAAVLILGVGGWFLINRPQQPNAGPQAVEQRFKNDVQPGTNNAVLTLADGTQVILDSAESGVLATEETVKVTRLENGEIVYKAPLRQAQGDIRYNTINNPKGSRVVSLTLADGSKVWLDAASSITYPTAFLGKERKVEMTGQAYFEVAPLSPKGGQKMPFIVSKGDMEVTVLGTHFNVMAFDEEPTMNVTLLEGSVRVAKGTSNQVIKPSEQAQLAKDNSIRVVNADIEQTMAWKNGIFKFQDITIEPLMKQLARWYDVEVVFEEKPTDRFVSSIPRDVPASQVFRILETTGRVHFKIEGKKVTVMK